MSDLQEYSFIPPSQEVVDEELLRIPQKVKDFANFMICSTVSTTASTVSVVEALASKPQPAELIGAAAIAFAASATHYFRKSI